MSTIREVKRRIKTSKNISQVTRAMEMVSAVKMKRAQDAALSGRDYIQALEKMVRVLVKVTNGTENSIFLNQPKTLKNILVIVIAPKKGLCGPLIGNLQRMVSNFVLKNKDYSGSHFSFVTLGKKSRDIVKIYDKGALHGKEVLADFEILEKGTELASIEPISDYAVKQLIDGSIDAVFIAYTEFISTMSQKPIVKQFLPIPPSDNPELESDSNTVVLFEPNTHEVLESLVVKYCQAMLYHYYLESVASEHSARMVAMKSAHDSAEDIIADITLYYNKMRQNSITTELADAVSSRLGQE